MLIRSQYKQLVRSDIYSDRTLKFTNLFSEIRDSECPIRIGLNVYTGIGDYVGIFKPRLNFVFVHM
jgi:hypothetical protein